MDIRGDVMARIRAVSEQSAKAWAESQAVKQRRKNADTVGGSTPAHRVYRELLHLQITFQEHDDEEAEEVLLDLLDRMWYEHPELIDRD